MYHVELDELGDLVNGGLARVMIILHDNLEKKDLISVISTASLELRSA